MTLTHVGGTMRHELWPEQVKKTTIQSVRTRVGNTHNIVVEGHVAMIALVYPKELEDVRRRGIWCGVPLALPERSVQVVPFAKSGTFANVKDLDKRLKLEQAACQLQVGVGDGPLGIF